MPYKMTHPKSSTEVEVNADQVKNYQSQGWQTKPTATPPAADKKK